MEENKMHVSEIKLLLALLLLVPSVVSTSEPTYQRTDPDTGERVTCQQCPPGTFVAKHCTSKSRTECRTCPEQHYTSYWNYVEKCRFCNIICEDREQVQHECNATCNRVCECKPGYHRESSFCVKDCGPYTELPETDDPECDMAVIDFVLSQNISQRSYRKLFKTVIGQNTNGSKVVNKRKIRLLLVHLKNHDRELFWRFVEIVRKREATLSHPEKVKKRLISQEEDSLSLITS
ncbi:tumor necrosis factor receptor superfamily member 6B [Hyperolius riggenbachi]|uniref:tumor necrosis factor receptor superfamily member 6B n=1 Tax=Hyperolius riggenbachi TaxID=752182 RepID=UPI0035A28F66